MKVNKFLSVAGIMMALAITGCGGTQGSSAKSTSSSKNSSVNSSSVSSKAEDSSSVSSTTTSKNDEHKHAWVEGAAVKNADGKDVIPLTCACGKVGAKMSVNDFTSSSFDSDSDNQPNSVRPSQKAEIIWNIIASKAGKYTITLDMFCAKNGSYTMDQRGFKVSVGGSEVSKYDYGSTTPDDLGMSATTAYNVILAEGVDLAEGANSISLYCAGYRLIYTNYLMIAEN